MARSLESQSMERGFSCCPEVYEIVFTPRCISSLSCIHEYLAIDSDGYVNEQRLHVLHISRGGVVMVGSEI